MNFYTLNYETGHLRVKPHLNKTKKRGGAILTPKNLHVHDDFYGPKTIRQRQKAYLSREKHQFDLTPFCIDGFSKSSLQNYPQFQGRKSIFFIDIISKFVLEI